MHVYNGMNIEHTIMEKPFCFYWSVCSVSNYCTLTKQQPDVLDKMNVYKWIMKTTIEQISTVIHSLHIASFAHSLQVFQFSRHTSCALMSWVFIWNHIPKWNLIRHNNKTVESVLYTFVIFKPFGRRSFHKNKEKPTKWSFCAPYCFFSKRTEFSTKKIHRFWSILNWILSAYFKLHPLLTLKRFVK